MEHQERALAAYIDDVAADAATLGVVVVGSVARGTERVDSDVDVYLVVDEERFAAETAADRFAWISRQGVDYPGSYIDVKLVSPSYLETAVRDADDPTRASFEGARVAFTRMAGLEELVRAIAELPADAWDDRIRSFVAQARLYGGYFLPGAVSSGDTFLLHHAGVHCALAAARAALAARRTLLRGPKYVTAAMHALDLPDGFVEAWDALVGRPGRETAEDLLVRLHDWLGDGMTGDEALSTFIRDNELAWLRGTVPAEFW